MGQEANEEARHVLLGLPHFHHDAATGHIKLMQLLISRCGPVGVLVFVLKVVTAVVLFYGGKLASEGQMEASSLLSFVLLGDEAVHLPLRIWPFLWHVRSQSTTSFD